MSIDVLRAGLFTVAQAAAFLLVAPLLHSLVKKMKAGLQLRQGPPLLQGHYDLAKLLRVSRSTIERRRHEGSFPIPELVAIDRRPRWSRRAVLAYLATSPNAIRSPRGRPRSREAWR